MARWRVPQIQPPAPAGEPFAAEIGRPTSRCSSFLVETPRGVPIRSFACRAEHVGLCPCYFDALEAARLYTDSHSRVCLVIRAADRAVMARTGPRRKEGDGDE